MRSYIWSEITVALINSKGKEIFNMSSKELLFATMQELDAQEAQAVDGGTMNICTTPPPPRPPANPCAIIRPPVLPRPCAW